MAHEEPELDLWLSRRNRMSPGDRLWFYFSQPESAVAALAEIDKEPYEDPEDPEFSYRVEVTLLPEATDALHDSPVSREELGLGQVRSVQKVKPAALSVLLARAGLEDDGTWAEPDRATGLRSPRPSSRQVTSGSRDRHAVLASAAHRRPGRPERRELPLEPMTG
ncbi:EVE domain-containing protein [Streptomyces collinus]|uniref:EVE domain-containing protein n=1 Tax=Streptomyces collinus TaxID=42684 RepID=UPI00382388D8